MPNYSKVGLRAASLFIACGVTIAGSPGTAAAETDEAFSGKYAPLTVRFNKDTWIRFIVWNQVWTRLLQNNPGTITGSGDDGEERDEWSFDVGLRRARFLVFGKIADDVLVMFHLGANNQTFRDNVFGTDETGPAFFIHDAWTEFKILQVEGNPLYRNGEPVMKNGKQVRGYDLFRMDFGLGLMYWNGISRATNASTLNLLSLDGPITNWPLINANDQFARQLGLYVKGNVWRFDYRFAVVRPFSDFNRGQNEWAFSSYISAQFLDREGTTLPYAVGTYLGAKKVFNIGAGTHFHPGGSLNEDGEDADILLSGADVFLDIPFGDKGSGGALTAYAVFYNYDFGRDQLVRNIGIMNPHRTVNTEFATLNGAGNAYPSIGDGVSVYGQVGYLLPVKLGGVKIQPYITGQLLAWDAYDDAAPVLGAGSNFYLYGHHAKFTLHYRARPIFVADTPGDGDPTVTLDRFASEIILQSMVFL